MVRVFADTSGLFAALVRNDRLHRPAKATLERLVEGAVDLHATSYVLLETLSLLQSRVGLEAAREFEHAFRPLLRIRWVDEGLHDRAFRRLELRGSRGVSLVDCVSFVTMEDAAILHAFSYDEDFSEAGFTLVREAGHVQALL